MALYENPFFFFPFCCLSGWYRIQLASAEFCTPLTMPLCLCIYLLVLFWSSIGVAVDDCFYPDGRYAVALSACNKQSPVTQCCRQGDVCLTNGLCFSPGLNLVLRRGCTDKTWRSTKCPDICTTGMNSYQVKSSC